MAARARGNASARHGDDRACSRSRSASRSSRATASACSWSARPRSARCFPASTTSASALHGRLALRPLRLRGAERRADRRDAASRCAIRTAQGRRRAGSASTRRSSSMVWVAGGVFGPDREGVPCRDARDQGDVQWTDTRRQRRALRSGEIDGHPGRRGRPLAELPALRARRRSAASASTSRTWARRCSRASSTGRRTWTAPSCRPIRSAFGRDYREFGLYGGVTQELGPHSQVGARYDFYNPDADSTNQVMGAQVPTALAYQTLSLTAALARAVGAAHRRVRHQPQPQRPRHQGNPANLADNAFIVRGEVSF